MKGNVTLQVPASTIDINLSRNYFLTGLQLLPAELNLRKLRVDQSGLSSDALLALLKKTNRSSLHLLAAGYINIDKPREFARTVNRFSKLNTLFVNNANLGATFLEALNISTLKILDLSSNRFPRIERRMLTYIPNVRELDLRNCRIKTIEPESLLALPLAEKLHLDENPALNISDVIVGHQISKSFLWL